MSKSWNCEGCEKTSRVLSIVGLTAGGTIMICSNECIPAATQKAIADRAER